MFNFRLDASLHVSCFASVCFLYLLQLFIQLNSWYSSNLTVDFNTVSLWRSLFMYIVYDPASWHACHRDNKTERWTWSHVRDWSEQRGRSLSRNIHRRQRKMCWWSSPVTACLEEHCISQRCARSLTNTLTTVWTGEINTWRFSCAAWRLGEWASSKTSMIQFQEILIRLLERWMNQENFSSENLLWSKRTSAFLPTWLSTSA